VPPPTRTGWVTIAYAVQAQVHAKGQFPRGVSLL